MAGILERVRHRARLRRLDLRVSVNGSRGKSTVTRLLTGALAAAGHRVVGKTTGTEPRLIRGWTGEEAAIHRPPTGPNIGEQRQLVRTAVADDADGVVVECMAIKPEYQRVFHRDLLDVDVLVVTNALDDHLDEMGPTRADVADVFAASIPHGGTVVTVPGPHLERLRDVAAARDAHLVTGAVDAVPAEVLERFDHLVMPEHVAVVLAVTRHLDIDDRVATDGMIKAPADPFATRLLPVGAADDPALFVNAFPANDPASTLAVWEHVTDRDHRSDGLVVLMHCRADRVHRTRRFAAQVLPHLPIDILLVTGESTGPVVAAVDRGRLEVGRLHDLTGADTAAVMQVLDPLLRGRVVLGVGNLHGGAADLVAALERRAVGGRPSEARRITPHDEVGAA